MAAEAAGSVAVDAQRLTSAVGEPAGGRGSGWMQQAGRPAPSAERELPGLPAEIEERLPG